MEDLWNWFYIGSHMLTPVEKMGLRFFEFVSWLCFTHCIQDVDCVWTVDTKRRIIMTQFGKEELDPRGYASAFVLP